MPDFLKRTKFNFGWGSAPDLRGSSQRSSRPPSGFRKREGKEKRQGEGRERKEPGETGKQEGVEGGKEGKWREGKS